MFLLLTEKKSVGPFLNLLNTAERKNVEMMNEKIPKRQKIFKWGKIRYGDMGKETIKERQKKSF